MPIQLTEAFVALAAANFESLVQFYRQLLEQDPTPHRFNVYAEFQLPGLKLGIFRPKVPPIGADSGFSLCLEVSDLEVAIAHLSAIGSPPPGEILTASHGREIYAHDPEGNRLILHQANKNSPLPPNLTSPLPPSIWYK